MAKCNALGRGEARSLNKLEKAKEKIRKLKTRIQELETVTEMKDNEILRALKASKKSSFEANVLNVDPDLKASVIDKCKLEDKMKEPAVSEATLDQVGSISNGLLCSRKTKRFRCSKDIRLSNSEDDISALGQGITSYTLIDEDASEVFKSHEFLPFDSVPQQANKDAVTKARCLSRPEAESHAIKCPDGTKWPLGKWCKRGHGKGFTASSAATQGSSPSTGDLIAVGADGRGGRIKVLRSLNPSSLDGKETSTWAKKGKYGAKTSSLQSQGCMQIEHFFGRAGQ